METYDEIMDGAEADEMNTAAAFSRWIAFRHEIGSLDGYRPMPTGRTSIANRGAPKKTT
jgi:hypothetical protein